MSNTTDLEQIRMLENRGLGVETIEELWKCGWVIVLLSLGLLAAIGLIGVIVMKGVLG